MKLQTSVRTRIVAVFLAASCCVGLAWAQAPPGPTPVQRAEIALKEATDAKASAERVAADRKAVAEKAAVVQTATEQALASGKASADKAAEAAKTAQGDAAVKAAKEHADKAAAALKAAEEAVAAAKGASEKAAAERAAADKAQGERTTAADNAQRKLLAERAFAANMALRQAGTERAQADQALAQKVVAANQKAAEKAAADQAAVAPANEKAASEKMLAEKTAAAKAATDAAAASGAVAVKAVTEKAATEKALAEKTQAAKVAADADAASQVAAEKVTAEKAAAEKTLAEKTLAAKTATDAATAETDANKKKALDEAAAKIVVEKTAAEKTVAEKTAAAKTATEKAATDKATAAKLAAEKTAAEKALTEKTAALKPTADKAVADKAAADKVTAEKTAAEKALAEKAIAAKAAADKAAAATTAANQATTERTAAEQTLTTKRAAVTAATDAFAAAETEVLGGLKPITSGQWDYVKARHLLSRAGFGGPSEEVERLVAMGPHAAVDHLVEYHRQPAPNIVLDVRPLERPLWYEGILEPIERDQLANERNGREQSQLGTVRQWWLRRMAESPRPLEEKLTLFWHDHFAAGLYDKINQIHFVYKQNETFRTYADKYDGLLRDIIHDPATIIYLDNQVNRKGAGNENLGREVLELFSLGRDQGYTEQDLRELARSLTGYSYVGYTNQFRFNGSQYDEGPKTILGRTGNFSADEAMDIILQHPSTGRYITKKLFEFFAHRQPSDEVINRLAHVLRSNNYDLGPMLKSLFLSEEFYSERAMAQQIKSPVELLVGTIRMLKIQNANYGYVDGNIQAMGQTLFQPPNVAGWEEGRTWISANRVMLRYNGVADLVEQPQVDVFALVEGKASNPTELVDLLARACLVTNLNDAQRKQLIDFVGPLPPPAEWAKQRDAINAKLRALLVLLMSTPEYQLG